MNKILKSQLRVVGLFGVFVLPFATLFYFFSSEIQTTLDRTEKERDGLVYIVPLRHLLQDLTVFRSVARRAIIGNTDEQFDQELRRARDAVKNRVLEVEEVNRRLGGKQKLATNTDWVTTAQASWKKLERRNPQSDPLGFVAQLDGLITELRQLIRRTGDTSNLILDPALDSYYYMDGVVLRLPKLADDTSRTRDLGLELVGRDSLLREDKRELVGLVQIVRESQGDLGRGMRVAYDFNATLETDLGSQAQSASATDEFLAVVERAFDENTTSARSNQLTVDQHRALIAEAGTRAMSQQWLLYDRLLAGLDDMLRHRVESLERRLNFVQMYSLIVLLVTTYVFYQFAKTTRSRMQTEFHLRDAEAKYRAIFENANEGIFQTSPDGKYLSANPALARIYGFESTAALMKSLDNIGRQLYADPARRYEFLHLIQENGEITDFESQVYRRDGTMIWINEKAHVIRDEQGKVILFEGTVEDVSERKRFQQELVAARDAAEDANRTKSQFLANMSHELRTPLNAIIGYAEMLQEEAEDLEQKAFIPDLQKIHGAGKHLLTLINDVLDLSKIEAGKMELFLEEFQVQDMVGEVCATIGPVLAKNSNEFLVEVAPDAGSMRGDLTKIRQILFNLLSNASKFTNAGQVRLSVVRDPEEQEEYLTFTVQDTGIGMTTEQLDRLFQSFSQADASTTRKYGGTGLGLAITRKFCEMMGGSITATSSPGEGSTFVCRLPRFVATAEGLQFRDAEVQARLENVTSQLQSNWTGSEEKTGSVVQGRGLVLVVDDDPTIHDMMRRLLSREGFEVATASSGGEGLELARKLKPNVITLDVMMPGMDGWAVLSTLKADPLVADIPVIMLSMLEDKSMGFALGATDYLTKPFDRERLTQILHRYASSKSSSHPSVLIIEDDSSTRGMLRRMLEKENWNVEEAANGRLGIEKMEQLGSNLPRLILLDLMMPEMDGFAFVELLQARDNWRTIPVVVVTAKDIGALDRQRLHGTVQQILQKGAYSRDELLLQVRKLVSARVDGDHRGT